MPIKNFILKALKISPGGFIAIGWVWYQNTRSSTIRILAFPIAIALSGLPMFVTISESLILRGLWFFTLLILIINQTILFFSKYENPIFTVPWQITLSGFLLIGISFVAPPLLFTDYGFISSKSVTQSTRLFYNKTIQTNEAQLMASFLKNAVDTSSSEGIQFRLHKTDSCFVINFVTPEGTHNNDFFFLETLLHLELKLNNQDFFTKPIRVVMSEAISGKTRALHRQFLPADSLNLEMLSLISYQFSQNQNILYNVAVSAGDLLILEKTLKRLKNYFPEHHKFDIIFVKYRREYVLKFFVPDKHWSNHAQIERYINIGQYLEKSGLNRPVRIELIDRTGKRFRIPCRL